MQCASLASLRPRTGPKSPGLVLPLSCAVLAMRLFSGTVRQQRCKEARMPTTPVIFDTVRFARKLEQRGFIREQAEGLADLQSELLDARAATRRDITDLRRETREMEMRLDKRLDKRLEVRLAELRAGILKWVAGMPVAQAAVIAALAKLL
jgi:hypothetical protein